MLLKNKNDLLFYNLDNYKMSCKTLKELKHSICNDNVMGYDFINGLLDYLVVKKIHDIRNGRYLVDGVDKSTLPNLTTYTNKNDTMVGNTDLHCWVVRDDGSIYNPEFKIFDEIKVSQNIDKNEPIILEPFSKDLQLECLKEITDVIKTDINIRKVYDELDDIGDITKIMTYLYVKEPIFGKCWCNAWYYKKLYGGKFVIGRMGWRKKDGTVYYEFG